MAKASMNLGMYVGFLNPNKEGKLLLRRRVEEDSIIPGKSFKGNWELPGGGVEETSEGKVSYDYPIREAIREAEEEVGISVSLVGMPPVFLTFFKKQKAKEGEEPYDLSGVIPVVTSQEPAKGDVVYVSPEELKVLAEEFAPADRKQGKDGKGLLSGWGKRMCCMTLKALYHSPNPEFAKQAQEMLAEIQKGW